MPEDAEDYAEQIPLDDGQEEDEDEEESENVKIFGLVGVGRHRIVGKRVDFEMKRFKWRWFANAKNALEFEHDEVRLNNKWFRAVVCSELDKQQAMIFSTTPEKVFSPNPVGLIAVMR